MNDEDLATVELLCRLQLVAKQLGCRIVVREVSDHLRTAIITIGLADVLLSDGVVATAAEARNGSECRSP